jgi:hypothetical protein
MAAVEVGVGIEIWVLSWMPATGKQLERKLVKPCAWDLDLNSIGVRGRTKQGFQGEVACDLGIKNWKKPDNPSYLGGRVHKPAQANSS